MNWMDSPIGTPVIGMKDTGVDVIQLNHCGEDFAK